MLFSCRVYSAYCLFYTMQNLSRFCDLHSNRPLPWTLIPQGLLWWGKKNPSYFHALHTNQFTFSQSISMLPSGCSKIPPLIFFLEHSHFPNTESFVKCPHHTWLASFMLCLFLSLCLNLYKSLSNPSIISWPKSTCDFVLFLSLNFCIAEGCWCWCVGWSAVKESD